MVNTPVPTMLPMTSPVAEVSPRACDFSWLRGERVSPGGAACGAGGGTEGHRVPFLCHSRRQAQARCTSDCGGRSPDSAGTKSERRAHPGRRRPSSPAMAMRKLHSEAHRATVARPVDTAEPRARRLGKCGAGRCHLVTRDGIASRCVVLTDVSSAMELRHQGLERRSMAAQGSGSDEVLQADSTPRSWCSTKGNLVVRRGASGGVTDHTATGWSGALGTSAMI